MQVSLCVCHAIFEVVFSLKIFVCPTLVTAAGDVVKVVHSFMSFRVPECSVYCRLPSDSSPPRHHTQQGVVRVCNVVVTSTVASTQATSKLSFVAAQQLDFGRVLCAVWSPCGRFLCVGGEDDAVSVLRIARMERKGDEDLSKTQPRRRASMMHFVKKQKQYEIGITPVRVLQEHTSFVSALTFDASGQILATGGYDGRICCWYFPHPVIRAENYR